ncbi:MAG TPA: hypothetical protein VGO80_03270 [Solirubrobacteraceae bacterium]|jgi:hypothetical protein|nr:hypothetical protein [Solirubrobacteraceae bacterium]
MPVPVPVAVAVPMAVAMLGRGVARENRLDGGYRRQSEARRDHAPEKHAPVGVIRYDVELMIVHIR